MINLVIICIFLFLLTVLKAPVVSLLKRSNSFTAIMFALYIAAIASVLTL